MKIQRHHVGNKSSLVLVPESDEESEMIDSVLGKAVQNDDGLISNVIGEVRLSDGYGEHYIRLWATVNTSSENPE